MEGRHAVNVRGYTWPGAWLGTTVKTGRYFVLHGGVRLTRSGAPVAGLRPEINKFCTDANQQGWLFIAVRTDMLGRYSYTVSPAQMSTGGVCAVAVAYPTDTFDSFVVQSSIRRLG